MRILITGASGQIGNSLALALKDTTELYTTGKNTEENPCLGNYLGYSFDDINVPDIDICFHQAACTDTTDMDREYMMKTNVYDSLKLFNNLIKNGCKHIVYASSCAVYGNQKQLLMEGGPFYPQHPYAESKLALDKEAMDLAVKSGVPIVGLRYSNVYGGKEAHKGKAASMVYKIYKQLKENAACHLYKWGEQARDFVYIEDVIQANIIAGKSDECGVYNIGSGCPSTFNKVVNTWRPLINMNSVIFYIENPYKDVFQEYTNPSIEKARSNLGYNPVYNLQDGIKHYLDKLKDMY